jgi:hypothetical protein
MTAFEAPPYRAHRPFFSDLPAYVLTTEDESGRPSVSTDTTSDGCAILCYLSPVDALIDTLRFKQIGQMCDVTPAYLVPPAAFRDIDGQGLIAHVHLGWPVAYGKLLLRPSGTLARYAKTMHHSVREPLRFEFDETVLAEMTRLHELAGLFAWRDTLDQMRRDWQPTQLIRAAARALSSIELEENEASRAGQIALFDPETQQWHFVPLFDLAE